MLKKVKWARRSRYPRKAFACYPTVAARYLPAALDGAAVAAAVAAAASRGGGGGGDGGGLRACGRRIDSEL